MGGHTACRGKMRYACKILVRKPKGKIPLRRTMCKWEDDIRLDLREIGWEGANWIHLAQDRDLWQALVNMVMKLPAIKGGEFLD
jgi:hypothetical protein